MQRRKRNKPFRVVDSRKSNGTRRRIELARQRESELEQSHKEQIEQYQLQGAAE